MNHDVIYDAFSGVDEKYLSAADNADAIRSSFRKNRARKASVIGTVVACVALVLAAGWLGSQNLFGSTPAVAPGHTATADLRATVPKETAPGGSAATDPQHAENSVTPPTDPAAVEEPSAVNGVAIPTAPPADRESPPVSAAHGPFLHEGDPPIRYRTLVEAYGDMQPVKYRRIGPGDHLTSKALGDAIAAYGNDNVTYRLRLTAFYEPLGSMTPDEQRAFYLAEADRFKRSVADLSDKAVFVVESFKDDNTGEEIVTFSAHLYDPSFLAAFPDNPDFGYLIELFGEPEHVK